MNTPIFDATDIAAVSTRIKAARENAGMTTDALAVALGASVSEVADWEAGMTRPSHAMLVKTSSVLGIGMMELALGEGRPAPEPETGPLRGDDFAARLREARERHFLTQAAVARHLGKSRTAMTMYESGLIQPSMEDIASMASLLKVDPGNLAFGQPCP